MLNNQAPNLNKTLKFEDDRGSMSILLENSVFMPKLIKVTRSHFGVLRGFHAQLAPLSQQKKIYVLEGEIQDVLIKLDETGCPTGEVIENIMTASNNQELHIPTNWAHAYLTLSERSTVLYVCDESYGNEISLNPLKNYTNWKVSQREMIISKKDLA